MSERDPKEENIPGGKEIRLPLNIQNNETDMQKIGSPLGIRESITVRHLAREDILENTALAVFLNHPL